MRGQTFGIMRLYNSNVGQLSHVVLRGLKLRLCKDSWFCIGTGIRNENVFACSKVPPWQRHWGLSGQTAMKYPTVVVLWFCHVLSAVETDALTCAPQMLPRTGVRLECCLS